MEPKTRWALVAAVAAFTALVVHLLVPMVHWEDAERDTSLYPAEVSDVVGDTIGGPMLASVVVLAVGGLAVLAARTMAGRPSEWVLGAGGVLATIGGAWALHVNALWTGRGLSTLLHQAFGTDAPSKEIADISASTADYPAAVWAISPPIVLVLAGLAVYATWRAWAGHVTQRRGLNDMARRHARVGALAMGALAIALIVPWSIQVVEDATTPAEGQAQDEDAFLRSPYDVLRIQEETAAEAQDTREAGIIQYEGLAILLTAVVATGYAAIVAAGLAIAGTHVASQGQVVWGRLLENTAFLSALALAFLAVAAFLGTFWLYDGGDLIQYRTTGAPLLLLAAAGPGLWASSQALRELVQEDSDPVADDFPEPVMYD